MWNTFIVLHLGLSCCFFLLFFSLLKRLICYQGSSVFFDEHLLFHLKLPLAFFSHVVFVFSPFIPFPFCHQSLQAMIASLHSELDIQRYLMKIQSPYEVSLPFILSATCWVCVSLGVCGCVLTPTSIYCMTVFPTFVLLSFAARMNWSRQWRLLKYQLKKQDFGFEHFQQMTPNVQ